MTMQAETARTQRNSVRRKARAGRRERGRVIKRVKVKAKAKAKAKAKRAQAERVVSTAAVSSKMLSFRMDVETRELVDRAADVTGQNRTDFMVTALRERATEVLLNQTLFTLSGAAWSSFVEILDSPPPPNAKLKALLERTPAWE